MLVQDVADGVRLTGIAYSFGPLSRIPNYDEGQRQELLFEANKLDKDILTECKRLLSGNPDISRALTMFNANPLDEENTGRDLRTGAPITDSRKNIGVHCVKVALGVEKICAALVQQGVMTEPEAKSAVRNALGHDLLKSLEIDRRNSALKDGKALATAYSEEAYQSEETVLREYGVAPELLREFISFGSNTGHNSIRRFLAVENGRAVGVKTENLTGLLAHVVDSLTYSGKPNFNEIPIINVFVPAEERIILSKFHHAANAPENNNRPYGYPFLWSEGLGVNESFDVVHVADIDCPEFGTVALGSFAYLQTMTARAGAAEILKLMGVNETDMPDKALCEFLNAE